MNRQNIGFRMFERELAREVWWMRRIIPTSLWLSDPGLRGKGGEV